MKKITYFLIRRRDSARGARHPAEQDADGAQVRLPVRPTGRQRALCPPCPCHQRADGTASGAAARVLYFQGGASNIETFISTI